MLKQTNVSNVSKQVTEASHSQSVTLKTLNNYKMDGSEIYTDILSSQTMNPTDFGDPLTFPLAPPRGSHLWL